MADMYPCRYCAATFSTAGGRGNHEKGKHPDQWRAAKAGAGVTPSAPLGAGGNGKARPEDLAQADPPVAEAGLDVDAMFGALHLEMIKQDKIVSQCLKGLADLLGQAKALRAGYIEKADRLRKLQVEIDGLRGEEEAA